MSYPADPRELVIGQEIYDPYKQAWQFVRFDGNDVHLRRRRIAQTPETGQWQEIRLTEDDWIKFVETS